ncbi:MAG: eCIS core domain-containing protein, partial [Polyangia bacterium]
MSTQDRAIRDGGEGEHASEQEGGDAAVGADVAGSQTLRMRAMQRRWIQRKASRGGAGGGAGGAAAIPDGAGAQLSGDEQKRMERTIGTDLSGVRVHTGGDSAEAADAMGARAFTVGSDVHFNRGEFAPGSKEGDRLLAHELTHVAQGQKSGVQRKADAAHGDAEGGDHEAGGHEVSEPGDPAEHEADAMGDHAAEKLHGGGEHGGGEHGGGAKGDGEHGGKKVAREKPAVGVAAPTVGRKIFRAEKPGAPPKQTAPGSTTTKGPGKGGPQPPAAQQPQGLNPADQQKIQRIKTSIAAKPDFMLVSTLRLYTDDVTRLTTGDQAKDPAVIELKTAYDAKWTEVFQTFDDTMNAAAAGYGDLKKDDPGAFDAFKAVGKSADA